jgi:hypothetical protein
MDARTPQPSLKAHAPGRHLTARLLQALPWAGRHTSGAGADAGACSLRFDRLSATETFKKTPCAADLNRGGRDVAKDLVEIPATTTVLFSDVNLTDAALAERKTNCMPRATDHTTGALLTDAQQLGAAVDGAAIHRGGVHEKQCYADI